MRRLVIVLVAMLVIAVTILMIHPLRNNLVLLNVACVLTVVGVWIEKGMGLVIPGSVPTPLGEILEYLPNMIEVSISIGIWSMGLLIFTLLAKAAAPIECNMLETRHPRTTMFRQGFFELFRQIASSPESMSQFSIRTFSQPSRSRPSLLKLLFRKRMVTALK